MKFTYRTEKNAKAIAASWGKPIDGKVPYEIKALSEDAAELWVLDALGWPWNDINAMIREVSALKAKELLVRLNTPGGDIIDTFALYQAIKNHSAKVTVRIESLAASAGSVLAMAGDKVEAYPSSLMMIHNAWVCVAGNRFELQDTADLLEKIDNNMQEIYTAKTKIGKREIADMLKNETWLSAREMKEKGFIDSILDGKGAKAAFDLSIFNNLPDEFKGEGHKEPTEREIERLLRDGGVSNKKAKAILAGCRKAEVIEEDPVVDPPIPPPQNNDAEIIAALKNNLKLFGGN
jgi:ATP-dependent protease ClpP protease subunit